jgi:Ca2+ transporting ATPase
MINEIDEIEDAKATGVEENQTCVDPFKVSKEGINFLIQKYLNRKGWEDVDYLKRLDGYSFYEAGLCTSLKEGLDETPEQRSHRSTIFDTNERPPDKPIRFCEFVLEALSDKIIIILIFAACVEIGIGLGFGRRPELDWIDGFAIIIAVIVVTLVGSINNYNKEMQFRKLRLQDQQNRQVFIKRKGEWTKISEEALMVGDIMKLESGMTIPCDSLIIEGSAEMDESAMTGEIDLIGKGTLENCLDKADEILQKREKAKASNNKFIGSSHHEVESPIILSGTQVDSGDGSALILTVGINSENGKIRATIEANKSSDDGTPLEQKLNDLADKIGWGGLIAAILTSVGMGLNLGIRAAQGTFVYDNSDPLTIVKIFIIGITVVVVAIPEGLPLAVTMTLAFSINKMLKDDNFVRRMASCETMGNAEYVCTDKTGTLTKNEMQVTRYYNLANEYDLTETATDGWSGDPMTYFKSKLEWEMFKVSLACNTNTLFDDSGNDKGNKSDESLTKLLKKFGCDVKEIRETLIKPINGEKPQINFTSKRKKMSTVVSETTYPTGRRLFLKGASEIVIKACTHYLDNDVNIIIFINIIFIYLGQTIRNH